MKFKFLLTLATGLLLVGLTISVAFTYYISEERLELIDIQLREIAASLVNSEFADLKKIDFEKADEIISEEIGVNRIGKLFIVRNNQDQIVFSSKLATLANVEFKRTPKKYTTVLGDKYYRVLNLDLPNRPDRTLQVAVVLDAAMFSWVYIFKKLLIYFLITTIPIMVVSYFLTKLLLRPITSLSDHMLLVIDNLKKEGQVSLLPSNLKKYTNDKIFYNDEFSSLLKNTELVLERINVNFKMTKPWSYQMAHELKTPLALLSIDLDSLKHSYPNEEVLVGSMKKHISQISTTVTQFLDWASLDSSLYAEQLFAIRIDHYLDYLIENLNDYFKNRIVLKKNTSFVVFCNPQHLIQLLNNLIDNALKYSDDDVQVILNDYQLIVTDKGKGISSIVLERLGQPFNKGPAVYRDSDQKSTGLGLAWVISIAKKYNWEYKIQTSPEGTSFIIDFSNNGHS